MVLRNKIPLRHIIIVHSVLFVCGVLALSPVVQAVSDADKVPAVPLASLPVQKSQQAVYGSPIRNADGTVNAAETVRTFKSQGTDVIDYLLFNKAGYDSRLDAASLPEVLRVARTNKMKVWVTIVPPSEGSSAEHPCTSDDYPPYYGRYDSWISWLAGLKRANPSLSAVIIDDFGRSYKGDASTICQTYSNTELARWKKVLSRVGLQFAAVMYQHDFLKGRVYAKTSAYFNFVVWPFTDLSQQTMGDGFDEIKKANPKVKLVIMVFARAYKGTMVSLEHVRWSARAADSLAKRQPSRVYGTVYYQPETSL